MCTKLGSGVVAAAPNVGEATGMEVAAVFTKNASEQVWAYLQPYGLKHLAHVRVFVTNEDGEMVPTKKGIAVKPSDLPKLAQAVVALIAAVEEQRS